MWGKPCCLPRGHHDLGNFLLQALVCSSKGMRTLSLFLQFRAPGHRDGTTCLCVRTGMQSFAGVGFWHRLFSILAPCQPIGHLSWLLLAAAREVPGSLQAIHSSTPQCPAGAAGLARAPALQVGEGTQNNCKAFRMLQKPTCLGFCLGQVKLIGAFVILSETCLVRRELVQDGARQLRGAAVAGIPACCGVLMQWYQWFVATHHVGEMGRTLPGGQWPCKAALSVSSAEDTCPQGQQSWEQGSCSHLGARRGSLAWSRGCVTRRGQAGMQEDLQVLGETHPLPVLMLPQPLLRLPWHPSPPKGGSGKGPR